MKRGKELRRRSPMKRSKPKKRRTKQRPGVYGPIHRWIKTLPCLLAYTDEHECEGPRTGHHVHSVGAGGADYANEVPLCEASHLEGHNRGWKTFERRYGVDLEECARWYGEQWDLNQQRAA